MRFIMFAFRLYSTNTNYYGCPFLIKEWKYDKTKMEEKDIKGDVCEYIDCLLETFYSKDFLGELNKFQHEIPVNELNDSVFNNKYTFPIYFYNLILAKYNMKLTHDEICADIGE